MNLNQLRYFVSVAESGSFTRAAINQYISQTAITQQIRALEETVGAKLFDRNSRPVSLTPAGKVFLKEAREILGRMDVALSRIREASTGLEGDLRLGYTKGYEHSDLPKYLRVFHQEYPNVLLLCHRCDTDALASGLLSGEYDIIFTWDSTNIRSRGAGNSPAGISSRRTYFSCRLRAPAIPSATPFTSASTSRRAISPTYCCAPTTWRAS